MDRRLRPFGRLPIAERQTDDIYIVGFPKSGCNWLQNVAAGLFYGVSPGELPDSLIQELVPDIDYYRHYQRHFPTCVFRTHKLPQPEFRRVVYLIRDPRDVFVSLLHFRSALKRTPVSPAEQLRDSRFSGTAWRTHVESWLDNPYAAEILTLQYEELRRDTVGELKRLSAFLGLSRNEAELRRLAEQTSFQRLREKEELYGKANPPNWPSQKRFFRRGQADSHVDELSAETETLLIEQVGPVLQRCGYSVQKRGIQPD